MRTDLLLDCLPHLPAELKLDTLPALQLTDDPAQQARVCRLLLEHALEPLLQESLESALSIHDRKTRYQAIQQLLPALPSSMIRLVLSSTTQPPYDTWTVKTFRAFAQYPRSIILVNLMQACSCLTQDAAVAEILLELACRVSEDVLPSVTDRARQILAPRLYAGFVIRLAPHLSSHMSLHLQDEVVASLQASPSGMLDDWQAFETTLTKAMQIDDGAARARSDKAEC